MSVCLWLNNSKTAEPIGLKLMACLLFGPGMVLGLKNPEPVTGSPENRKKTGFQKRFVNGVSHFFETIERT